MTALGGVPTTRRQAPGEVRRDSLESWLAWLDGGPRGQIELGLDRCHRVSTRLGISRPAPIVVTVAGTNGKGSTVAMLDSVWRAAGYRVGTYTSPHLIRYNERIRIDGEEISDVKLCDAFEAVEAARGDIPLTYFEFGTLAALMIFEGSGLDVALLEVGLGGRLDAVNIIDSDVAVITSIGLDHEQWLGSTREAIGFEKSGIMRAGRPVVCSDNDAPESVFERARELDAELALLGRDFSFDSNDETWNWWSKKRHYANLPQPQLEGRHQIRNASGALKVIELLQGRCPVSDAEINRGLSEVVLHGRFHRVDGNFQYVADVAHNPQAADVFVATLAASPCEGRTHALIGMLNTKNHVEYLRRLISVVDEWHFATLPGPQGAGAEELRQSLEQVQPGARSYCHAGTDEAHTAILASATTGDRIVVLGSFITVGALLKRIVPIAETSG